MDGLQIVLIVLFEVVSCSRHEITGSLSEVTVRRGDNVTVYCDCKLSTGVYIVWYRNCSHENQPTLALKAKPNYLVDFQFLKNFTSNSFDLLIINVTESDEGLYYCGNEEMKVVDTERIIPKYFQSYGKGTTRILLTSRDDHSGCSSSSGFASWRLVVLAPAVAILSSLLSFILVHHFCQKSDKEPQVQRSRTNRSRRKIRV
ncbi:uncharacterized protein LOC128437089 isoform X3 [Pleuronectes platessa]|uniref:uncharacterized protein LOC128437089 isoform X3 n=1 Tax=Pleuronectes platessa TaxID=8262 RepID=UPI00232A3DD5|nr:uncharacterized protein LOC128437089 isoform X3 [Pleuronectes platessa]XP_053275086.1 uncharacterized protein LOC128437089 isoform X3 [Pleuronectes platessa]